MFTVGDRKTNEVINVCLAVVVKGCVEFFAIEANCPAIEKVRMFCPFAGLKIRCASTSNRIDIESTMRADWREYALNVLLALGARRI